MPSVTQAAASIVAHGARMRAVAAFARWNADDDAPLLIVGEPGSGRQFIARLMHDASCRHGDGFASIPAPMLSVGRLRSERRRHATLVIAGIESLTDEAASFLPRVMRAVGGRVIATGTAGADRSPFEGAVIEMPALRQRREDIVALTALFLGRPISPPAIEALLDYDWPGNVRELRETCEWITRTCRCRIVKRGCLPARIPSALQYGEPRLELVRSSEAPTLDDRIARFEAGIIEAALESAGYNRSRAARLLGIKRSTLVDRIRRLGVGLDHGDVKCA